MVWQSQNQNLTRRLLRRLAAKKKSEKLGQSFSISALTTRVHLGGLEVFQILPTLSFQVLAGICEMSVGMSQPNLAQLTTSRVRKGFCALFNGERD